MSMTGRDLIIYILENNLENEPLVQNGKPIGFITVGEAASKMNVGVATISTYIYENLIDYCVIGNKFFIFDKNIKRKE